MSLLHPLRPSLDIMDSEATKQYIILLSDITECLAVLCLSLTRMQKYELYSIIMYNPKFWIYTTVKPFKLPGVNCACKLPVLNSCPTYAIWQVCGQLIITLTQVLNSSFPYKNTGMNLLLYQPQLSREGSIQDFGS